MSEITRVKNVVETVVTDDHFADVGKMVNTGAGTKMSKAVMKAYRKAKKVCAAENVRSRKIASDLRIKREGAVDVTCDTAPPSPGEQASIFDF